LEVLSLAGFKGSEVFGRRAQTIISVTCAAMLLGFGGKFVYDAAIEANTLLAHVAVLKCG